MADRLLALLEEHSVRREPVRLASGETSDFFVDVKQTALLSEGHVLVGRRMLAELERFEPRPVAVAGVALGGCSLASAVSCMSFAGDVTGGVTGDVTGDVTGRAPFDAIYVRKSVKGHGTKRLLEGDSHLPRGSRVAVLEDVVTTGGSTLYAIERIEEAGLEVAGVVALVDRQEGGAAAIREAGHGFSAIYTREDFVNAS